MMKLRSWRTLTALGLLAICGPSAIAQTGPLLLAGTPNVQAERGYPATLYRIGTDKKIIPVEHIVSPDGGGYAIVDGSPIIYVVLGGFRPTRVTRVSSDASGRPTEFIVNSRQAFLDPEGTFASEDHGGSLILALLSKGPSSGGGHPASNLGDDFELVASNSIDASRPLRDDAEITQEYRGIEFHGLTGGPYLQNQPTGKIENGECLLTVRGRDIPVAPAPAGAKNHSAVTYLVVDRDIVIFTYIQASPVKSAGETGHVSLNYLYERQANTWRQIKLGHDASVVRHLGPWVAIEDAAWKTDNDQGTDGDAGANVDESAGAPRPVTENPLLPNVKQMYADVASSIGVFSGTLQLMNFTDGREISLSTGQEDSEILAATEKSVWYRVGASIYKANIVGNRFTEPALIATGDDVPQVHWMIF